MSAREIYSTTSEWAKTMCAPFWWSVSKPGDDHATVLQNGTVCYVHTGEKELGITADHVYAKYLEHLAEHGDEAIECQFGGSTIAPEKRAVANSARLDIATFDVPNVFVTAAHLSPRTQHRATIWPPKRAERGEEVIFGGYPGILREDKRTKVDFPFQWILGKVADSSNDNIVLEPDFEHTRWLGDARNGDPRGMSGGPVFRVVPGIIAYLEIIGFIVEFPFQDAILARHAAFVQADGTL
jgi:hypothetical protein